MNICILGTGYVGLVSAACFAEMGNHVVCIDVQESVIENLKKSKIHIFEPGLEELVKRNAAQERLLFSTDLSVGLAEADIVFICVGTPPREDGSCDLSYVINAAQNIGETIERDIIVVDKSTVPVGTADLVKESIDSALLKRNATHQCSVVSNPEFLKEGDAVNDFMKPDRVILGTTDERAESLLKNLYAPFARTRDKILVMSPRSAEMTKYAANCMLATKISFMNEIAKICEKLGADVRDVRNGIGADHRIGYHFIYPGLGYGGSCFPKDVKALIHLSEEAGIHAEVLSAVESVNKKQKVHMAHKVVEYFSTRGGVASKTLALWGLAFKANTDDIRESPSLAMVDALVAQGMKIRAFDPEAGENTKKMYEGQGLLEVVGEQYEALRGADCLLVATEWNQFRTPDFKRIFKELTNPVIFDGRNLYDEQLLHELGFTLFGIGKGR